MIDCENQLVTNEPQVGENWLSMVMSCSGDWPFAQLQGLGGTLSKDASIFWHMLWIHGLWRGRQ